jgi:hypothetical protein
MSRLQRLVFWTGSVILRAALSPWTEERCAATPPPAYEQPGKNKSRRLKPRVVGDGGKAADSPDSESLRYLANILGGTAAFQ